MTITLKPSRRLARLPPRRPSRTAARELLKQVRAIGGDAEGVVRRAGLANGALQLIESGRSGHIERDAFARIYAECIWVLDAHECLIEGRVPISKAEVDMLCYCVITCRTLREAIDRTIDFSRMLMPRMSELSIRDDGIVASLTMHTIRSSRSASAFVSDLTGLAMFYRLFSWLIGEDIRFVQAEVCYGQHLSADTTARLLPCPIRYDAPDNVLHFVLSYLDRPVVRSYAELLKFLDYFPFDLEEGLSKATPLSERVRLKFVTALATQSPLPDAAELAQEMSVSPATLRRRLSDEGVSLRSLKEGARREMAEHMLRDGKETLEVIATTVGFHDVSAFSRAFRGWTGSPPRHWALQTG